MYNLFKGVAARKLFVSEAPSLAASIAIAEFFYSSTVSPLRLLASWPRGTSLAFCFISFFNASELWRRRPRDDDRVQTVEAALNSG